MENLEFNHVLPALPVCFIGVVYLLIPRTWFMGIMEILMTVFSVFMVVNPRQFIETFIPQKSSKFNETDELFIQIVAAQILSASLISFLTRRNSSEDQSMMKSLMTYWLSLQTIFAMDSVRNCLDDGTVSKQVKTNAGKTETVTEFDILEVPQAAISTCAYDLVVLAALIVALVRWPQPNVRTRYSIDNTVNKYLLFDRALTGCFMVAYVLMPEVCAKNALLSLPLSSETPQIMRLIGLLGLCYCGHVKTVESYHADSDKVPFFKATLLAVPIMFGSLLARVFVVGSTSYKLEHWVIGFALNAPLVATKFLGYLEATKRKQKDT